MTVKELRPKLDPVTCAVCGRRLLQGEEVNWFIAPDSSRRAVCELCVSRAERARWLRERDGEQLLPPRLERAARGGIVKRLGAFLGAGGEQQMDIEGFEAEVEAKQNARHPSAGRDGRRSRRRSAVEKTPPDTAIDQSEPRTVRAVPTGPAARLAQGLELFNTSQFPRTIAGLSRSLGDPKVAAVNHSDNAVEIYVGWDIAWYSYRVDLGDATEPVEQSGRGNDSVELAGVVSDWNAVADDYGRLLLRREGGDA